MSKTIKGQPPVNPTPAPSPPSRAGLDIAWAAKHQDLYDGVKKSLAALPDGFNADIQIGGIDATDLFGMNSALGSAIERHVVEALNNLRHVWDSQNKYPTYAFVRYPQSFPDVRLIDRQSLSPEPILMGIELKGWFALSKEKEPSFRFTATPLACAKQDLIVVVPWVFNNVLSGHPILMAPFIDEARYVAEMRNYYWEWVRGKGELKDKIVLSGHITPYPDKAAESTDKPVEDGGNNFGRVARANILTEFVERILQEDAAGIPIQYWVQFLAAFTENPSNLDKKMASLAEQARQSLGLNAKVNGDDARLIAFLQAMLQAAEK